MRKESILKTTIEKKHTLSSDIDVLIVSTHMPKSFLERGKIRDRILKEIGVASPFEIYLANLRELECHKNL